MPEEVYRDLRAGAESGWDFSSRWLGDTELASIRTTQIAPVDLNAFLFGLERAIAAAGDGDAAAYAEHAAARREAMQRHCWHDAGGYFADYDLAARTVRAEPSAASLAALYCRVATDVQAARSAQFVQERLLAPGGLRTTLVETGQQWDMPNGWAPLQWIAVSGLRKYGHEALAREIALRWIGTVERTYARTGLLYEKYDIEARHAGGGGEYLPQIGFGWTNGVTSDLLDLYARYRFVRFLLRSAGCSERPVGYRPTSGRSGRTHYSRPVRARWRTDRFVAHGNPENRRSASSRAKRWREAFAQVAFCGYNPLWSGS
jgi:alpha,alpha-trehalase